MLRKLLIIIFCFLATSYRLQATGYAQDKIVAIVNNESITQKDLDDFLSFMRMQLSRQYRGQELENKVQAAKSDLLDKLIEDKLILQEAKKSGMKVDESRVKARVNDVRRRYPSDIEFQNDLMRQGMVQADLESRIREQLLMYNIIEIKVRSKIVVRPEEVTSFYNKNPKEFVTPEARDLDVIMLESQDLANSFAYNLKTGQKIEELATRYPITVDKLMVRKGGELRKDIEDVVFKLGVGEISDPVASEEKFYIFKLNMLIPPRQQSLTEAQSEITEYIREEKMQRQLTKWLDEIKNKSYIKKTKS